MNAPRAPMPIAASRFGYPFKDKDDREIVDPYAFIEALIPVQGGHYLLGSYGFFHGGIHLDRACSSKLSIDDGIRCLADGEVVAYRIDSDYHDATPGAVGDGATLRPYSTGFVLVRHRLQAPSPPMPAKPPPMETPGADIRDWGTRLYADPLGRKPLAWLRHGTPLIVEVGSYAPGQSTLVRVTDTLDSNLPREGWISRTHLALDPAAGTGMRSAFGLKDTVATTVYRGDSIDPEKSAAHAENKAQRQRPDPETAPVLTLYSLYMHVASERDYGRNAKWKRPSWWPERDGTRMPDATDRVVTLSKPLPIRQGDLIGYLGEDVPARAYPLAGQPVTKRLLHLEVFSGDDVPAYLVSSRRWAKENLPDGERTLLLLMPGDTLQRDVGGPTTATVNQRQILRVGGLESRTVEGKRWRKVTLGMTQGHATGWIEEDGRLISPWEWPGFDVQDEVASPDGFRHDDPEAFADYLRGDGPRPPDTPFYKALRSLVDRNHDGSLSEEELDRLLRNRHHADHLTRLIVRHETAWTRTSMRRHTETARRIAAKLGPAAVENVNAEEPRSESLPWWEDVAAGVEGFPVSSRVWHFHAGGVAGNFPKRHPTILVGGHQVTLEFLDLYDGETIGEDDFALAAQQLGCEVAAIKAVALTETGATGSFYQYEGWDCVPAILFERHYFHKLTAGRFSAQFPEISNPTAGGYGRHSDQYRKLLTAYELDGAAALQSASWGRFQIMGRYHQNAGHPSIDTFVRAHSTSEKNHLKAFVSFISADPRLRKAIVDRDWLRFATTYNGPQQKGYDHRMEESYERLK